MKCSKTRCPIQHNMISDDCDLEDCPYRTEPIDLNGVMEAFCNHIADLVVEKLVEKEGKNGF